jgi:hypothetical protein
MKGEVDRFRIGMVGLLRNTQCLRINHQYQINQLRIMRRMVPLDLLYQFHFPPLHSLMEKIPGGEANEKLTKKNNNFTSE